jgi:hypothetical protein
MPALKSSANSPVSKSGPLGAFCAVAVLGACAAWLSWSRGYTFFYGDAEAHLNIARRIFDTPTPGLKQIGTVWLPLPHLLMAALARYDSLWASGFAGILPSLVGFALAGGFLFASTQKIFDSKHAGWTATLLFATNLNMLYLAATPMTEPIMAAALAALLWATLRYRETESWGSVAWIVVASNLASMTRYEGWFLIPFVAAYVAWASGDRRHAWVASVGLALGPLTWLLFNQMYFESALAFYNGPYSAQAIAARQMAEGMIQPAQGNWSAAALYYGRAIQHVIGMPLLILGAVGTLAALLQRRGVWPLLLLLLPAIFYLWSLHTGGTTVFVPELEPYTRYNTRYALVVLPLVAFMAAALVAWLPLGLRRYGVWILLTIAIAPSQLRLPTSICWEEARLSSEARREWTAQAAKYLSDNYQLGSGVVFWFGDLAPAFRQAGIPLREGLYQDSEAEWKRVMADPAALAKYEWAFATQGDPVDAALHQPANAQAYRAVLHMEVKGTKPVTLYRRNAQ